LIDGGPVLIFDRSWLLSAAASFMLCFRGHALDDMQRQTPTGERFDILPSLKEGEDVNCLDCFAKINKYEFAGFVHHGSMVPEALGNQMLLKLETELATRK
jgi:hypothetical protein